MPFISLQWGYWFVPPKHYRPHTALVPFTVLSAPLHAETAADLKREKSECKEERSRNARKEEREEISPQISLLFTRLWNVINTSGAQFVPASNLGV